MIAGWPAFAAAAERRRRWSFVLLVLVGVAAGLPAGAAGEQASQPGSVAAGQLDVGGATDGSGHTCAVLDGRARCWGFGGDGRLGYGNERSIGDDESPGSAGPVDLAGHAAVAISAGAFHSCALLDGGGVRCWGFGGDGRLGYASRESVGDDESPAARGPVDLGDGRTARAISAGLGHTCVVLDNAAVRCWGFGDDGRLGYGKPDTIGDDETPASVGSVDLGAGRSARAVSAGGTHTCALLDDGSVRCWGFASIGQLGYANGVTIGDDETPAAVGPVDLGAGRSAQAISAGNGHTCAVLDDGSVRCWGFGANGRLGYANTRAIGDDETPGTVPPVDLGAGRRARAISAGDAHTCALLDDGSVRCWGMGSNGRLGYANTNDVGDDETPASAGPVDLGAGRVAIAISAGARHSCALLDDHSIRCWGAGAHGRLGYCNERDVGDDETPERAGPVNVATAEFCSAAAPAAPSPAEPAPAAPAAAAAPAAGGPLTAKLSLARARIVRRERVLDVLAPITRLASGRARVQLHAAGLIFSFGAQINEGDGRIRFRKLIPKAQARLGTGIITIAYRGDANTRPQTVRLRAASQRAALRLSRPTLSGGRLRASGSVSRRARGVVRVQIEYVVAGRTHGREFKAPIDNGRWSLNERVSHRIRADIARRTGALNSYTVFTGFYNRRIRGEMRFYQVLPAA